MQNKTSEKRVKRKEESKFMSGDLNMRKTLCKQHLLHRDIKIFIILMSVYSKTAFYASMSNTNIVICDIVNHASTYIH